MRTLMAILIIVLLIVGLSVFQGCASITCNEVMGQKSYWKSGNHMVCSMGTFDRKCAAIEKQEGGWHGCKVAVQ